MHGIKKKKMLRVRCANVKLTWITAVALRNERLKQHNTACVGSHRYTLGWHFKILVFAFENLSGVAPLNLKLALN